MKVCIAEKPSVARDIAKILGATHERDGYLEGNGYQVTWAFGHLCELKQPDGINPAWKKWSLTYLPMIPERYDIQLIPGATSQKQFKIIKQLYKNADEIINCGDAGQEGELIQRWIMQMAGVRCPVKRLWISSLTAESIRSGFQSLRPQSDYDSLYEAGLARAEGDWLLGMNASRLYTMKYGNYGTVLSIGRVQTPTLAIIVNRDREIANFRPEPYWVLQTVYRGVIFTRFGEFNGSIKVTDSKFKDNFEAHRHLAVAKANDLKIYSVEKTKGQELCPQLYDLTALQVDCNKKYGYSADKTLKTMQSLYEKKVATYPRVDTRFLTHDIYDECPKILRRLKNYSDVVAPLEGEPLPKSKRVFDDSKVTDHHAIIPTGETNSNLSDAEMRVYNLICNRFIAVFYPPCVYAQTVITATAGSEAFKTTGKTIIDLGWKQVYGGADDDEESNANAKEKILPEFRQGETSSEYGQHCPELVKKLTTAPKHYTEATLLQAMETAGKFVDDEQLREAMKENGIGRPSSRAGIIETLLSRKYLVREKKNLLSTETGRQLIDIIKEPMLKDPGTTGLWERKLRMIEQGKFTLQQFMSGLEEQITKITAEVKADSNGKNIGKSAGQHATPEPDKKAMTASRRKMSGAQLVGKTCPECGIGIVRKGKYSYFCTNHNGGCNFKRPL